MVVRLGKDRQQILGNASGSGILGHSRRHAAGMESQGGRTKSFYKPRGRALYDIADLDA